LLGIRKHFEQDWLESLQNILSAKIFGDYLEMAEYLNEEGFYIAAAVIAGTTMEERLRQLCIVHGQPTEAPDKSGAMKPLNAEILNGSLTKFYSDGKNDVKLVTRCYGLRNDAAHGNWNADSGQQRINRKEHVGLMIGEIRLFIKNNLI
jgi:hypothetical protein